MTWLRLIAAAVKALAELVSLLRESRLMDAGKAKANAESLQETNARVEKALAARRAAAARGLSDDDGYRRD